MLEAGGVVAESKEQVAIIGQTERASQRLLAQMAGPLVVIAGSLVDRTVGAGKAVLVDHQCPVIDAPVGVGEDILVYRTVGPIEIEQQKILALGEQPALVEKWCDLPVVAGHQSSIWILLVASAAEFHAVLFRQALDLPVAEHR